MIKLKDLLIEQNDKVLPGRIVLVSTDSASAPNKNSFARFQTKNGIVQGDSSDADTKAIRSEGSAFSKKFSFVEKTLPEQDYLKIGNIVINSQTDITRFEKANNRLMFQPVEASGNGVYLLSRLLEAWDDYMSGRSAPDSVILKMNATRAGIQMVEFNPSLQNTRRKNAGPILCGYCFVQAGIATPEFLERRQFAIDPNINYNNPVNSAYSFFPSLKDDALRKNSEMISLGNDLQSLVDSFVSKYKGKKMVPTDQRRNTFWPTPWRDAATNDLIAMSKTLSDTFKSRHKMFISLKLQEFGVDPVEGNVLDAKIDKYWSLAGVYPKIVSSLFGEPKKGGTGGTRKGVAAGGQTTSSGKSGNM